MTANKKNDALLNKVLIIMLVLMAGFAIWNFIPKKKDTGPSEEAKQVDLMLEQTGVDLTNILVEPVEILQIHDTGSMTVKRESGEEVLVLLIGVRPTNSRTVIDDIKRVVENRNCYMEFDELEDLPDEGVLKRDKIIKYGYIYNNEGLLVNLWLINSGKASYMPVPPNIKYHRLFETAQNDAINKHKGIWR